MIISFAHTTPALIARRKTVTRREWQDDYAARIARQVPGLLADAWNVSPRVVDRKTGKPIGGKVATIKLLSVTKEPMTSMPDEDYEGEGFGYLYEHPESLPKTLWGEPVGRADFSPAAFDHWRSSPAEMWVVRFELIDINTWPWGDDGRLCFNCGIYGRFDGRCRVCRSTLVMPGADR
ncbi:MAG: hypothetical protein KGL39_44080 [Patescibacteria group bacterium]|nr:hypothetical protein [Patescibacteria group bacterium]